MPNPFCPRCGAAQDPSNLFCPKCGHQLPPDEPVKQEPAAPIAEKLNSGNEAVPAEAQDIMSDEFWFRLQAEEQEYSRRSKRNMRIGCLTFFLLIAAVVIFIWYFGGSGSTSPSVDFENRRAPGVGRLK